MGKMELQHSPCCSAKALSVSNRATGDRHSGRVFCFTLVITLQTRVAIRTTKGFRNNKEDRVRGVTPVPHTRKTLFRLLPGRNIQILVKAEIRSLPRTCHPLPLSGQICFHYNVYLVVLQILSWPIVCCRAHCGCW